MVYLVYMQLLFRLLNVKCNSIQSDANAAVFGIFLYGLGQTSLSTLTTVVNGKASLSGATFTGQITSQFSVHLSLYGAVSVFNSAGTAQTPPLTTAGFYYLKLASNNNYNWAPSYTTSCKLAIPYTGIYSISWSMCQAAAGTVCNCFISKNLMNGGISGTRNTLSITLIQRTA